MILDRSNLVLWLRSTSWPINFWFNFGSADHHLSWENQLFSKYLYELDVESHQNILLYSTHQKLHSDMHIGLFHAKLHLPNLSRQILYQARKSSPLKINT